MSDFLDTYVGKIEDPQMHAVLADLEVACRVSAADFEKMSLWSFLVQCVYPQGSLRDKQVINAAFLPHESLLEASLEDVQGSEVFAMCDALLRRKGLAAELSLEETVVDVLNAMLPTYDHSRSTQETIDDVTRQRRLNRG